MKPAAQIPFGTVRLETTPFPIPEKVDQLRWELDWQSYLPARAQGFAWQRDRAIKRAIDVVLASAALLVLSPLLLLIAIAVKVTSRGPIFYEWRVLGKHARPFVGWKFRTMVPDADRLKEQFLAKNEMTGPVFKMRNDPRITPIGRFLRKYSLDELPQLWSVVKGDMSLVGPRPPGPEEFAAFKPWQWAKLAVTPGITCLWQVNGRTEISEFDEWARLDLQYIQEWNLWLDCRILLLTVPAVLRAKGAY